MSNDYHDEARTSPEDLARWQQRYNQPSAALTARVRGIIAESRTKENVRLYTLADREFLQACGIRTDNL
jgi:hypothetical protein